jgi:hypothetical protein
MNSHRKNRGRYAPKEFTLEELREKLARTQEEYPSVSFCTPGNTYLRVNRDTWLRHLNTRAAQYGLTWWAEAA